MPCTSSLQTPAAAIQEQLKIDFTTYTTATIAIMIGVAVLNATAFIRGNCLARALGWGDKAALEEKKRHNKALEDYQAAYAKYTRANKGAGQAELHQHGLRLQTLQLGAS